VKIWLFLLSICGAIVVLGPCVAAAQPASPTPTPGGANQASGVEGTFGEKLFNGEVRLEPRSLRDASPADGFSATPGNRWLVFRARASNGTPRNFSMTQFIASIVDASGDTIQAQPDKVRPVGGVYGVPPGGAWDEQIFFLVPDSFKPSKIVLAPYDGKRPVFRITVRPEDYHGTPSGATSPSA
jgi:hypothetical protein